MILTLLNILACGGKSTDTSTVIEDTSSTVTLPILSIHAHP